MIWSTLYAVGASLFADTLPIIETTAIVVDRADVRISDVVVLQDIASETADPTRLAALGAQSFLTLRPGQTLDLSHSDLRDRLVKRVPGLAEFELRHPEQRLSLSYVAKTREYDTQTGKCWRIERNIARGDTLLLEDVRETRCEDLTPRAIGFDRSAQLLRASRDLNAGQVVASQDYAYLARMDRGASLDMVVTRGPVQVKRPVTLVHPLRESGVTLVRTSDDQLLRAHLELKDAE